jgi:hypothetical protein
MTYYPEKDVALSHVKDDGWLKTCKGGPLWPPAVLARVDCGRPETDALQI